MALLASEMDRSKSRIIVIALREYLERVAEQELCWEQTRGALESVYSGRVVPSEDVHEWLRKGARGLKSLIPRASE